MGEKIDQFDYNLILYINFRTFLILFMKFYFLNQFAALIIGYLRYSEYFIILYNCEQH